MRTQIFALFAIATSLPASAGLVAFETPPYSYTTPPSDPNDGNPNAINGTDGWTQSEPTFTDPDTGADYPLFYTEQESAGDLRGTIGGIYAIPDNPPFTASRDFSVEPTEGALNPTLGMSSLSFDFSVEREIDFAGRNTFGVSITNGSNSLVNFSMIPVRQSGSPGAGQAPRWEVFYAFGNDSLQSTSNALNAGTDYRFNIDFRATDIRFTFQGGSGQAIGESGTSSEYVPLNDAEITTEFSFAQGNAADFSDNRMTFDNINYVPEPSVSLLAGLAGLGLLRRRRS